MGGVFFRRKTAPRHEVINDLACDIANLFRVLQRHYGAFAELVRFQVASRTEFDRLMATDPVTLTDLERAARFVFLQRYAFGGKVLGRNFAMGSLKTAASWTRSELGPLLEAAHARLAGVLIERLPFDRFIQRYDGPGVLFYVDPPYFGTEHYYGPELFTRVDFERLAEVLSRVAARFLLSINDAPEVRRIFGRFAIETAEHSFRLSGAATAAKELIVTGPRA